MRIILLGPPGAGKGTEGELIANTLGLKRISIGALLRRFAEKKTSMGLQVREYISQGLNVPPDLLSEVLQDWLQKNKNNFIIDNFPRSHEQLALFKKLYSEKKLLVDKVFHMRVSENTSIERLLTRQKERSGKGEQRIDESYDVIKNRYDFGYVKDVYEILEYFNDLGILEEINAERGVEEVHNDIIKRLEVT